MELVPIRCPGCEAQLATVSKTQLRAGMILAGRGFMTPDAAIAELLRVALLRCETCRPTAPAIDLPIGRGKVT